MTIYATAEELRAQPGMDVEDQDEVLAALLSAASSAVDGFCNRPDGFLALGAATDRVFATAIGDFVSIDEAASITSVATRDAFDDSYTLLDVDDWVAISGDPQNPNYNRTPYTGILSTNAEDLFPTRILGSFMSKSGRAHPFPVVQVTAKWGYAITTPAPVKQATIIIAARLFKRGESFWADTMAGANLGVLMYRKVVDPDVALLLNEARLVRTLYG